MLLSPFTPQCFVFCLLCSFFSLFLLCFTWGESSLSYGSFMDYFILFWTLWCAWGGNIFMLIFEAQAHRAVLWSVSRAVRLREFSRTSDLLHIANNKLTSIDWNFTEPWLLCQFAISLVICRMKFHLLSFSSSFVTHHHHSIIYIKAIV